MLTGLRKLSRRVKRPLAYLLALSMLAGMVPGTLPLQAADRGEKGTGEAELMLSTGAEGISVFEISPDAENSSADPVPAGFTVQLEDSSDEADAFENMRFTKAGTYRYRIVPVCPEEGDPGTDYDGAVRTVTVTVDRNLNARVTPEKMTFRSTSGGETVDAAPRASAVLNGEKPADGVFEFELLPVSAEYAHENTAGRTGARDGDGDGTGSGSSASAGASSSAGRTRTSVKTPSVSSRPAGALASTASGSGAGAGADFAPGGSGRDQFSIVTDTGAKFKTAADSEADVEIGDSFEPGGSASGSASAGADGSGNGTGAYLPGGSGTAVPGSTQDKGSTAASSAGPASGTGTPADPSDHTPGEFDPAGSGEVQNGGSGQSPGDPSDSGTAPGSAPEGGGVQIPSVPAAGSGENPGQSGSSSSAAPEADPSDDPAAAPGDGSEPSDRPAGQESEQEPVPAPGQPEKAPNSGHTAPLTPPEPEPEQEPGQEKEPVPGPDSAAGGLPAEPPMPDGGSGLTDDGSVETVNTAGGNVLFGSITFDRPGTYRYEIVQRGVSERFAGSLKAGGSGTGSSSAAGNASSGTGAETSGIVSGNGSRTGQKQRSGSTASVSSSTGSSPVCDDTAYGVTVHVTRDGSGRLHASVEYDVAGETVEAAVFSNTGTADGLPSPDDDGPAAGQTGFAALAVRLPRTAAVTASDGTGNAAGNAESGSGKADGSADSGSGKGTESDRAAAGRQTGTSASDGGGTSADPADTPAGGTSEIPETATFSFDWQLTYPDGYEAETQQAAGAEAPHDNTAKTQETHASHTDGSGGRTGGSDAAPGDSDTTGATEAAVTGAGAGTGAGAAHRAGIFRTAGMSSSAGKTAASSGGASASTASSASTSAAAGTSASRAAASSSRVSSSSAAAVQASEAASASASASAPQKGAGERGTSAGLPASSGASSTSKSKSTSTTKSSASSASSASASSSTAASSKEQTDSTLPKTGGGFTLHPGESYVFDSLPAGTQYSISMELPSGYSSVQTVWTGTIGGEDTEIIPELYLLSAGGILTVEDLKNLPMDIAGAAVEYNQTFPELEDSPSPMNGTTAGRNSSSSDSTSSSGASGAADLPGLSGGKTGLTGVTGRGGSVLSSIFGSRSSSESSPASGESTSGTARTDTGTSGASAAPASADRSKPASGTAAGTSASAASVSSAASAGSTGNVAASGTSGTSGSARTGGISRDTGTAVSPASPGSPAAEAEEGRTMPGGKHWSFDVYYIGGRDGLHATHADDDFSLKYQMEFHTSQDLDAGAVEIRIPRALLEYRDGTPFYPTDIAVPVVSGPDQHVETENSPFNCYVSADGGELVFFNYRAMTAGTNAAWQVVYSSLDSLQIIDMTEWSLQSTAEVTYAPAGAETGGGRTVTETAEPEPLTGIVNTEAHLLSLDKEAYTKPGSNYTPGLYTEKQVSSYIDGKLPAAYSGENFDLYRYVVWDVNVSGSGNQPFDLWIKDTPDHAGQVVGYRDAGYRDADRIVPFTANPNVHPREEYSQDLQSGLADSTNALMKQESRVWEQRFYVVVAYPADVQEEEIVHNDISVTLVPYDLIDEPQEMSDSALWNCRDYHWQYTGDVIGIDKFVRDLDPAAGTVAWDHETELFGWLETFRQSVETGTDISADFEFWSQSENRSFKVTHDVENTDTSLLGTRRPGMATRVVTVDDAVYVYPGGSEEEILLDGDDYYFSSVRIVQTDTGYDVWENAGGPVETASPEEHVDQGLKIYAMFAEDGPDGTSADAWTYVDYVPWPETVKGNEVELDFTFSAEQIARHPYRVMAVHDTVNYNTNCDFYVNLHIRPDSETMRGILERHPDMTTIQFENLCGVSGQVLTYGEPGDGIGTDAYFAGQASDSAYFHDSRAEGSNYSEKGIEDFTRELYGTLLTRDCAFGSGKVVSRDAAVDKNGTLTNDAVNGRANVVYSITMHEGYLTSSYSIAAGLIDAGIQPPDRTSVAIYDLLPVGMQMDPAYPVTAGRLENLDDPRYREQPGLWNRKDVKVTWTAVSSDWNGTGRTLIRFDLSYNSDLLPYTISRTRVFQGWGVSFRGYWPWKDVGSSDLTENITAVLSTDEQPREFIADEGQTWPDDGKTHPDGDFADFGEDLDQDGDTEERMLLAKAIVSEELAVASESYIEKSVRADSDEFSPFGKSAVVEPGGGYTYQITVSNPSHPVRDVVVFDHLENSLADRRDNGMNIPGDLHFDDQSWTGTFRSIITKALDEVENPPINYTVWFNAQRDAAVPAEETSSDPRAVLTAENGWYRQEEYPDDISTVKSLAVDLGDWVLQPGDSVSFKVCMDAPPDTGTATWAYNNPVFCSTSEANGERQTVVGDSVRVRLGQVQTLEIAKEYENPDEIPEGLKSRNEFQFFVYDTSFTADGWQENSGPVPFADRLYTLYTKSPDGTWTAEEGQFATDADGSLTLKADQKAVFGSIPAPDRITVQEVDNPFWSPRVEKSQDGDTYTITVKNAARSVLYVQKKTSGGEGTANADGQFQFQLLADGVPAAGVPYWTVDQAYTDGRLPEKKSEGSTDGSGFFWLRAGETAAIIGAADFGTPYTVKETDAGEDWLPDRTEANGTFEVSGSSEVFTNYYRWKDLLLIKTVEHQDAEDAADAVFTFRLDRVDTAEDGQKAFTPVSGNSWEQPATGDSGQLAGDGTFSCRAAAGTVTIHRLEARKTYRITETETGRFYEAVNGGFDEFVMPLYSTSIEAEIANTWLKRPLEVSKTLVYQYSDPAETAKAREAVFEMKAECDLNGDGNMVPLSDFPFTLMQSGQEVLPGSPDDPYGGTVPGGFRTAADGTFKIKGSQTAVFEDAGVAGSLFRVTETGSGGYTQLNPLDGAPFEGEMDRNGGKADIINGISGLLTIRKEWAGLDETGRDFIETGKAGEVPDAGADSTAATDIPDLSVEITMYVTDAEGQRTMWPPADTEITVVSDSGEVSRDTWRAKSPYALKPWTLLVISGADLEGVVSYEVIESEYDRRHIEDWVQDGKVHHIAVAQQTPAEGGSAEGTPGSSPSVTFVNTAEETGEKSRIGKRMVDPDAAVTPGAELELIVERFDGEFWLPAGGVPYVTGAGLSCDDEFTSDQVLHTGDDGHITLKADSSGKMPWVLFTEDTVYVQSVENPVTGSMRIRELLDESDPQWGEYVGVGSLSNDGSWTLSPDGLDRPAGGGSGGTVREAFVNTPGTVHVRIGKEVNRTTDAQFTFTLRQVTEADSAEFAKDGAITPENWQRVITKTVPGAGIRFTVHDAASGAEIREDTTDEKGEFVIRDSQYAELRLPEHTLWLVSEDVTPGFQLRNLSELADTPMMEVLAPNLLLIGSDGGSGFSFSQGGKYSVVIDCGNSTVTATGEWAAFQVSSRLLVRERLEEGTRIALPLDEPVRDGFVFKGWKLAEDAAGDTGGRTYAPGEEITVSASLDADGDRTLTFQPVWEDAMRYTVVIEAGDDATLAPDEVWEEFAEDGNTLRMPDLREGTSVTLPADEPVRPGYEFAGWMLNGRSEAVYPAGASFEAGAELADDNGLLTFAAVWAPVPTAVLYADGTMIFHEVLPAEYRTLHGGVTALYSGWDDAEYQHATDVPWTKQGKEILAVEFDGTIAPACTAFWFSGCSNLKTFTATGLDTGGVTSMHSMFDSCYALPSVDLSSWDTGNVTDMSMMFYMCTSLTGTGDLSGWQTGSAADMSMMFFACSKLADIGDISGWDTGSVTDMHSMFNGCQALKELSLSGWDVEAAASMNGMFSGCYQLTTLDLSGWNPAAVSDIGEMFNMCTRLVTIYADDWTANPAVSTAAGVFTSCVRLKGGIAFDNARTGGDMCRPVDGYFTSK